MKAHQEKITIETRGRGLYDATARIADVISRSGVKMGLATVFIQHTSASLVIQENAAPSVRRDMDRFMAHIAPDGKGYEHDDEGPDDMPAHLRAAITKTSEQIPIANGKLALGTWQAIYVWEHRHAGHARSLVIHVMGSP